MLKGNAGPKYSDTMTDNSGSTAYVLNPHYADCGEINEVPN